MRSGDEPRTRTLCRYVSLQIHFLGGIDCIQGMCGGVFFLDLLLNSRMSISNPNCQSILFSPHVTDDLRETLLHTCFLFFLDGDATLKKKRGNMYVVHFANTTAQLRIFGYQASGGDERSVNLKIRLLAQLWPSFQSFSIRGKGNRA